MPSTSPAQKRTMAAIAHGWRPKNAGLRRIPVSVAKDFNEADQAVSNNHRVAKMLMKKHRGK